MAKYKNISDQLLTVTGVGPVNPGEVVELADDFNNANFEKVAEEKASKKQQAKVEDTDEEK